MEYIIYRITGDKKPVSFQLPLKETFVKKFVEDNGQKKDLGYRRIQYVPGTASIYAEDHKGDYVPQQIWFERGEIKVRKDDKLLNEILQKHGWFGAHYKIWSEEAEDKEKLYALKAESEATRLIDESDPDEIKAIALAVFGNEASVWTEEKAELRLREKAKQNPKDLKSKFDSVDYSSRLLAGLAFSKGLVEENRSNTAVVWRDSDGLILKLAKGENGVDELGRFLSNKTEESALLVQSIGERLNALATGTKPSKKSDAKADDSEKEIVKVREEYEKTVGKVPPNMRNNIEWLKNRIAGADS